MRILALETSTRRATVALLDGDRLIAHRFHEDPRTHAERIVPLIDALFAESGFPRSSLDLVASGIGPGSFTGVRVALATGKGIALALDRPLIGIGSLRAMASGLPADEQAPSVIPLIDARKNEVFVAVHGADGLEVVAPSHVARASIAELLAPHLAAGSIVVGEVAAELDIPEAAIRRGFSTDLPDAAVIGRLASARAQAGDFDSLDELEPAYVRPPDIYPQLSTPRILRP